VETSGNQSIYAKASYGELGEVRAGLKAGFDVNAQDEFGRTLLHYAIDGNHASLVEFLIISFGANPNIADNEGITAVDVALHNGDPATLTVLENEGVISY